MDGMIEALEIERGRVISGDSDVLDTDNVSLRSFSSKMLFIAYFLR